MNERHLRVIRVLEFVGPESWINATLERSWLSPERAGVVSAPRSARELTRWIEETPPLTLGQQRQEVVDRDSHKVSDAR